MMIMLYAAAAIDLGLEILFVQLTRSWQFSFASLMSTLEIQGAVTLLAWLVCIGSLHVGGTYSSNLAMSTFLGCWFATLAWVWFSVLFTEWWSGLRPRRRKRRQERRVMREFKAKEAK